MITRLLLIFSAIIAAVLGLTKGFVGSNTNDSSSEEIVTNANQKVQPFVSGKASSSQKGIEIPTSPRNMNEHIITRLAYTLSYNKNLRLPNWVAWHLTAAHTKGNFRRTEMKFVEDESVPRPRATNWDYVQSGYDRGHMCPSGDNRWSEKAQQESFIYTNCCPQRHSLNSEEWEELESRCRHWANVYGDIYIVCGPMFTSKEHKTIGKNHVAVPDAFFKVVLRLGKEPAALGFTYKNEGNTGAMSKHVCTVDWIEEMTGIDFFPALDDKTEKKVEAEANLSKWK